MSRDSPERPWASHLPLSVLPCFHGRGTLTGCFVSNVAASLAPGSNLLYSCSTSYKLRC